MGMGSGFFFRPACGAGGADDGRVDEPQVSAQAAVSLKVVEQMSENLRPSAVLAPAVEPVVDGLPGPIAVRHVAPGRPGMEDPEDAVEQVAVGPPRVPLTAVVCGMGEEVFEPLPLA